MTSHQDKGILQIDYNFLNLPNLVKFNRTYVPRFTGMEIDYNVKTKYLYRADGVKLRKIYTYGTGKANLESSTITDYLDGFQYEENYTGSLSSPVLKFVPTSEGYYNFEKNLYIYNYTDHLGNVRLSYFKNTNGSAEVLEENNYYPFGLKHDTNILSVNNSSYKYQYNGKEYQTETRWNDFGARMYMSDIGRWGVIDPLAEQMRRYSPYNFAFNNPINFIDPDGMAPKRLTAASEDSPLDYQPGWTNPNWLSFGDAGYGDSYGFGTIASSGGNGSGGFTLTGNPAGSMFSYLMAGGNINDISVNNGMLSWWTNADGAQYGQYNIFKTLNDNLMEFVNNVDSFSREINKFPAVDFPAFLDKHFNGGLGYADVAIKAYNKIPNGFKSKMAYNLSKVTPWRAGKIFQNTKAFMSKAGKLTGKLGKASTALSGAAGVMDWLDDGNIKTSTVVNMGLLAAGLAFPGTAPFILAYGILDYTFDIGDKIDEGFGEIIHIFMIKSILKQWLFINYCGQKIGQFKGADLKDSLLNITTSNISFIIYGIMLVTYALLGFRSVIPFMIIAILFEFLITRKLIKKYIMKIVSIQELEAQYKMTSRWKRIIFFVFAIMILISSVIFFFMVISWKAFFND